jgi:hypothetical protein
MTEPSCPQRSHTVTSSPACREAVAGDQLGTAPAPHRPGARARLRAAGRGAPAGAHPRRTAERRRDSRSDPGLELARISACARDRNTRNSAGASRRINQRHLRSNRSVNHSSECGMPCSRPKAQSRFPYRVRCATRARDIPPARRRTRGAARAGGRTAPGAGRSGRLALGVAPRNSSRRGRGTSPVIGAAD